MDSIRIYGDKTYIRPITYDDTDLIVKWRNLDSIKSKFFYRELFTRETHEKWMKTRIETGEAIQFIVCTIEDNCPIGSTYLRDIDYVNNCAEYGVFIGEESARGRGLGKEILGLTLQYGWDYLNLRRVRARAIATNEPSINSFLRFGFKKDELVKNVKCSDGTEVDMIFMSISNER